jgi:hypothetical protein
VSSAPGLPFGDDGEDAKTIADAEVDAGRVDTEDDVSEQAPALVPVTVYHGGADVLVSEAPIETPRVPPVEATLGSEQLGRVRARYAEIMARITERAGDDSERLDELRRSADALNPDSWVTGAEITSGMQQFDERLGEIRKSLGIKRRRRSRRGGRRRRGRGTGGGDGTQGLDAAGQTTEGPEASDQEEAGLDVDSATDEVDGDRGHDASEDGDPAG